MTSLRKMMGFYALMEFIILPFEEKLLHGLYLEIDNFSFFFFFFEPAAMCVSLSLKRTHRLGLVCVSVQSLSRVPLFVTP